MNTWTRIGLVLLRVVIGWHFLFEGLDKLESTWHIRGDQLGSGEQLVLEQIFGESHGGPEGKSAWSAAGYLSESQGPLAPWFRQQAGDPDGDALAKLKFSKDSGKLPQIVEDDWEAQFDRFVTHYELGTEKAVQPENIGILAVYVGQFPATVPWPALARSFSKGQSDATQLALAREDFELARKKALKWFSTGAREVPSKLPGVDGKVNETTAKRIDQYQKTLDNIQEIEAKGMPAFERDVWKDKYRTLKKEAATQRIELLRDLNQPFTDMMGVAKFRLSKAQRARGPVPPPLAQTTNLDRINFVTRWGLALVGACLLLGLFTRTACVAGAGFLLMFCLAMPALPWLPANPKAEGHYQFIDKNIIEMIALLTLATTASGKWVGLDGLVQFLNPWRWRTAPKPNAPLAA